MITCKQVARSLADRDHAELPPLRRLFLKLHVLFCVVCGRYHRQVMRFQDGVRRYRQKESSRPAPADRDFCLRGDERDSIRRALESARHRLDGADDPPA